ncbi:MAG: putative transporter permease protein [Thermomicrobiales bacterium]|nr:putative transporter permease protein [Thermomicrobiales bacterium]
MARADYGAVRGAGLSQPLTTPRAVPTGWLDRNLRWLFIAPAALVVLCLSIFPLIASLGLSFLFWDFSRPSAGIRFAGLYHWGRMLADERFLTVLRTTILYALVAVPLQYAIGLVIAVVLNQEFRGRRFFRVFFLLPMMLSPVSISFIVGRMMFHETQGPLNHFLSFLGLPAISWLSSEPLAFLAIVLVDSWQWIPFIVLLLLVGLQGIPSEVAEAARLDGSALQAFWHVTFPLLLPWSVTVVLLRGLEVLKIFDVVVVLTGGGPGIATESLTLYAYQTGIRSFNLGYAAAIGYALLILAIVGSALFLLGASRWLARVTD